MTRQEMLNQLHELPYPIIEEIVVFNDGCEFCILTQREGFRCLVGGVFPILGPIKLSLNKYNKISELLTKQDRESDEDEFLWEIKRLLGADALTEMLRENWPPNKEFYVFHDMGRGESAFFPSLLKAYEHFITYFINVEDGIPWDSMTDNELCEWTDIIKSWRAKGAAKLPPREFLGAYYSPGSGSGRIDINEE